MGAFSKFLLKEEDINYYNDSLHPSFWEDFELDSKIQDKLLKIAKDSSKDMGIDDIIEDIQLTGSLANYNWTPYSDLDVHVLLDFTEINDDVDLVKMALDGKRFVWNTRHDIEIRGHEVELYYQDVNESHKASGLYSLKNKEWIKRPKHSEPEVDEDTVMKKVNYFTKTVDYYQDKVDGSIGNDEEARTLHEFGERLRDKVKRMRRDSLEADGEFGSGNLAFKHLRNTGVIERLIGSVTRAYDSIFNESTSRKYAQWIDATGKVMPANWETVVLDALTQDPNIRKTKDGQIWTLPISLTPGIIQKKYIQDIGPDLFYHKITDEQREQVNSHWLSKFGVSYYEDFPSSMAS